MGGGGGGATWFRVVHMRGYIYSKMKQVSDV